MFEMKKLLKIWIFQPKSDSQHFDWIFIVIYCQSNSIFSSRNELPIFNWHGNILADLWTSWQFFPVKFKKLESAKKYILYPFQKLNFSRCFEVHWFLYNIHQFLLHREERERATRFHFDGLYSKKIQQPFK